MDKKCTYQQVEGKCMQKQNFWSMAKLTPVSVTRHN